jgi:DNA-binding Lrp family transcriptional regulator
MREPIDLDAFDLRILVALQENGRLTNQELASASGCLPRSVRAAARASKQPA